MQNTPPPSDLTPHQLRDVVMRVTTACLSANVEINLKGHVGRELIGEIIAFQHHVIDPTTNLEIGEIDVETSTSIIEVTTQSEGLLQKIVQLKNDPRLNPTRKKVVLYAPHYAPSAAREAVEESIPVIQSLAKLREYIYRKR